MKVVWRRKARAEIDAIVAYISKDSPAGAVRVRDQILAMVSLLEMWPDLGRERNAGLRELVVAKAPYVVLYRRTTNKVTIVRVLHGMRRR
jgi:plasmid stabilization system protein ParE